MTSSNDCGEQTATDLSERWPLLGQILEHDAESLSSERRIDLDFDRYLRHHTLGGTVSDHDEDLVALPVVPFTFSMELVAEAAAFLAGDGRRVVAMHNLRGYRWLTLDTGQLVLRTVATARDLDRVHVRVYQEAASDSGDSVLVFEGDAVLGTGFSEPPAPRLPQTRLRASGILPEDLYAGGMFHGPMLQGVRRIRGWSAEAIEADLEVLPIEGFFGASGNPTFQIDAGLLDAAGQLVGYWLSEQCGSDFNCFPFRVDAFEQYQEWPTAGSRVLCRGSMRFVDATQIVASFELHDAAGRLIASLQSWQDRYFSMPGQFYACRLNPRLAYLSEEWLQPESGVVCRRAPSFPEGFLEQGWAIWQRVLAHLVLSRAERVSWYGFPSSGPRRSEWLLGRIAAKDALRQWIEEHHGIRLLPADIEISTDAAGKPRARSRVPHIPALPDISISHSEGVIVAAASRRQEMQIGIDLELKARRPNLELLQGAFSPAELRLLERHPPTAGNNPVLAGWCAKEAAAKATATGLGGAPRAWEITGCSPNLTHMTVRRDGRDLAVRIHHSPDEVLAVCTVSDRGSELDLASRTRTPTTAEPDGATASP